MMAVPAQKSGRKYAGERSNIESFLIVYREYSDRYIYLPDLVFCKTDHRTDL